MSKRLAMLVARAGASHALLVLVMASACASASADAAWERAQQRQRLVVALDHVVPEYKGGMKLRTPESIAAALAADIARRAGLPLATIATERDSRNTLRPSRKADAMLAAVADPAALPAAFVVIPTGYVAAPMAIMRSDTTIKTWEQLRGRTVCVSADGLYVSTLAAQYGAIEMVKPAPADALLALRTGACDATVHDSAVLDELIKLPEWKKFSAHLPAGPQTSLALVVPAAGGRTAATFKRIAAQWKTEDLPAKLVKKAVQGIAFEVYLDQNVPDCH